MSNPALEASSQSSAAWQQPTGLCFDAAMGGIQNVILMVNILNHDDDDDDDDDDGGDDDDEEDGNDDRSHNHRNPHTNY